MLKNHNEYHREYKARRRAEYLTDKSCVRCGATENLELDHIDPATKGRDFKNVWTWPEERRLAELAKTQVLCKPCHKDKTLEDWAARCKHGSIRKWKEGCRCLDCELGRSERQHRKIEIKRRWRQRRREQGLPVV